MKTLLLCWALGSTGGGTGQPEIIKPDAYGPGMHMDQYGGVIQTQPGLQIRNNVYGPGIGSDQYGRPVDHNNIMQPYGGMNYGR